MLLPVSTVVNGLNRLSLLVQCSDEEDADGSTTVSTHDNGFCFPNRLGWFTVHLELSSFQSLDCQFHVLSIYAKGARDSIVRTLQDDRADLSFTSTFSRTMINFQRATVRMKEKELERIFHKKPGSRRKRNCGDR